jgi:hypothetical protein
LPGRSFNSRSLYQWFDRGLSLICERLNNERTKKLGVKGSLTTGAEAAMTGS